MISFKQLEAIHWVALLGTFGAAAEKLHTSESAISKRISELEAICGVALFDRSLRNARLTRRGMEVLDDAKSILELRNQLLARMGKAELTVRRFRVGVTELVALTWLPRLVEAFRAAYPDISFEPEVDLSTVLCEKLEAGAIDLAIVPPVYSGGNLVVTPLKKLELSWMCRPGLVPAGVRQPLEQLLKLPVLAQTGKSGVDTVYDQWFQQQGLHVKKIYAGNSLVALAALTKAGIGISYLPSLYFQDLVAQGLLQEVRSNLPAPAIPYHAIYRAGDDIAAFSAGVAKLCVRMCDFSRPSDPPAAHARPARARARRNA